MIGNQSMGASPAGQKKHRIGRGEDRCHDSDAAALRCRYLMRRTRVQPRHRVALEQGRRAQINNALRSADAARIAGPHAHQKTIISRFIGALDFALHAGGSSTKILPHRVISRMLHRPEKRFYKMTVLSATPRFDRASFVSLADWLAVGVAVALPWSTSATGTFIALWLVVALVTIDLSAFKRALLTPAGGLPFCYGVLALSACCGRTSAGASDLAAWTVSIGYW